MSENRASLGPSRPQRANLGQVRFEAFPGVGSGQPSGGGAPGESIQRSQGFRLADQSVPVRALASARLLEEPRAVGYFDASLGVVVRGSDPE